MCNPESTETDAPEIVWGKNIHECKREKKQDAGQSWEHNKERQKEKSYSNKIQAAPVLLEVKCLSLIPGTVSKNHQDHFFGSSDLKVNTQKSSRKLSPESNMQNLKTRISQTLPVVVEDFGEQTGQDAEVADGEHVDVDNVAQSMNNCN